MKKLFFILTFLLVLSPARQVLSAPTGCERYKTQPELRFSTSYGKLKYDNSYSQRQLTVLGEKYGILEQGLFASGLATVNVSYQLSVKAVRKQVSDSLICVIPKVVDVYIGYQSPTIYISKDLVKDSCEYNVVLRHEQTHQQINTAALEYFIPQLQNAVRSILNSEEPIRIKKADDFDAASEQLVNNYTAKLEPLINYFKTELIKEQGKLDNYQNYKLEDDLCKYYHRTHQY